MPLVSRSSASSSSIWEQWSRERREVYSPLHGEVSRFVEGELGRAIIVRSGYPPRFENEFAAVVRSGFLHLKRHEALRRDIDTFRRLRDEADEKAHRLSSAAYDAVGDLYAEAGLESVPSPTWSNATSSPAIRPSISASPLPLASLTSSEALLEGLVSLSTSP